MAGIEKRRHYRFSADISVGLVTEVYVLPKIKRSVTVSESGISFDAGDLHELGVFQNTGVIIDITCYVSGSSFEVPSLFLRRQSSGSSVFEFLAPPQNLVEAIREFADYHFMCELQDAGENLYLNRIIHTSNALSFS